MTSINLDRIAHILSNILHPLILMMLTIFLISILLGSTTGWAFMDVTILVFGLLPGLIYIGLQTKRGSFTHYHLLLKEERYKVFPIMLLGLIAVLGIYLILNRPYILVQSIILGVVVGFGASLINRFWKVSVHAAVGGGCAALLFTLSYPLTFLLLILALISGLARIPIKHHTPMQVIAGWAYGFGATVILSIPIGDLL